MNSTIGTVIGALMFTVIVLIVLYKLWDKAKKEVPPDVAAKMVLLEDLLEKKLKDIKDKL